MSIVFWATSERQTPLSSPLTRAEVKISGAQTSYFLELLLQQFWVCFCFVFFFFNLHPDYSPHSFQFPASNTSSIHSLLSSEKGEIPPLVPAHPDTLTCCRTRCILSHWGQSWQPGFNGMQRKHQSQRGPLLQLLGLHMITKLCICYICAGVLGSAHACSLVGSSVSVNFHGPRLVDCRPSYGFVFYSYMNKHDLYISQRKGEWQKGSKLLLLKSEE